MQIVLYNDVYPLRHTQLPIAFYNSGDLSSQNEWLMYFNV